MNNNNKISEIRVDKEIPFICLTAYEAYEDLNATCVVMSDLDSSFAIVYSVKKHIVFINRLNCTMLESICI